MPLRKLISDDHTATKIAKVMHAAYDALLKDIAKHKISGVSTEVIARRVFDTVTAGEHDAAKVVAAIMKTLLARKS